MESWSVVNCDQFDNASIQVVSITPALQHSNTPDEIWRLGPIIPLRFIILYY